MQQQKVEENILFRKRYVTEIENKEDANYFLKKTSNDIGWCSKNSKDIPPFMKLEDWCAGKEVDLVVNLL